MGFEPASPWLSRPGILTNWPTEVRDMSTQKYISDNVKPSYYVYNVKPSYTKYLAAKYLSDSLTLSNFISVF